MKKLNLFLMIVFFILSCNNETTNTHIDLSIIETPSPTPTEKSDIQVLTVELDSQNIQVKNLNLLKDSVNSCVGQGFTTIQASMFQSKILPNTNSSESQDRIRFLTPNEFPVGEDIFEINSIIERLVDTNKNNRFTSVADSVSFTYLSTLQLIGDIVAHNCSSSIGTCQCSSRVAAAGLVSRCFPFLNQQTEQFNETVDNIKAICEQESIDGIPGFRVAIASIISSLAFAISR